ncbi:MAG: DNA-binding response regulator, partial [Marinobacter sp.]
NHLAGLKNKLQVSSSVELIHLAVDAGLIRYGQLEEARRV